MGKYDIISVRRRSDGIKFKIGDTIFRSVNDPHRPDVKIEVREIRHLFFDSKTGQIIIDLFDDLTLDEFTKIKKTYL